MLGEVVEIKTGLKNDPKDDKGNPIALGSIEVRIGGSSSNLGQIRNIYARPAVFNTRFPAIGEIVMLFTGPANDWSTTSNKGTGIYYMSPINATDDMTLHSFWKIYFIVIYWINDTRSDHSYFNALAAWQIVLNGPALFVNIT
jgi:hypothetical protein